MTGPTGPGITTLHVSQLPLDFRERELYMLFVTFDGFTSGHIKYQTGRGPLAFATFDSREHAQAALEAVNGMPWHGEGELDDAGCPRAISVSFSQTQSRTLRTDKTVSSNRGHPDEPANRDAPLPAPGPPRELQGPCATLFIGNIDRSMSEAELWSLFGAPRHPQLRKLHRDGNRAWASYEEVNAAAAALRELRNWCGGAQRLPLKIAYARAEMRQNSPDATARV